MGGLDAVSGLELRVLFLRKVQMFSVWRQKESTWICGLPKVRIGAETLNCHLISILPSSAELEATVLRWEHDPRLKTTLSSPLQSMLLGN